MKNVIKRGTSLLLVLAMLLSFAAVVGAEEPATPEKILTLTVENAVLHAGETKCLPVYETVKEGHSVDMVTLSAISDNKNVVVKGVYAGIPAEWTGKKWIYKEGKNTVLTNPRLEGISSAAAPEDIPLLTWLGNDDSFTTSDLPLCYVQVTATADAAPGAYQINMTKDPNVQEKTLFSIVNPEGGRSITKTVDDAILNPGTVVVIPQNAELPTVILTQSSFAAPTQATYDPEQGVDLLNYLKIVDRDGNLHDASSAADTSITGNYVSNGALKLTPTSGNSGNIIVNNLHAADDASITASATLNYTVTKDTVRTPWKAGFSTYNGKYKTQADFDADFAKNPPKAPVYNGGAEHNSTSVYPNVFDQYGEVMDGYSFVPLVTLYNAADHTTPLANEAGNADPAYSAVHFNYNTATGKWASDTLYYTKELKKDVWCKIELGVIVMTSLHSYRYILKRRF